MAFSVEIAPQAFDDLDSIAGFIQATRQYFDRLESIFCKVSQDPLPHGRGSSGGPIHQRQNEP